eukprot:gene12745-6937_t
MGNKHFGPADDLHPQCKNIFKIIMLGAGDCGQSTIMKHLKILVSGEKPTDSNLFYGSLLNFTLISFEYMEENSIKFEKQENFENGKFIQNYIKKNDLLLSIYGAESKKIMSNVLDKFFSFWKDVEVMLHIDEIILHTQTHFSQLELIKRLFSVEEEYNQLKLENEIVMLKNEETKILNESLYKKNLQISKNSKKNNKKKTKDFLDMNQYYDLSTADKLIEGFQLSTLDYLHSQRKTTGIARYEFSIEKNGKSHDLTLIDVAGHRSERKKWRNIISESNRIIFVVDLSDFDRTCFEDDITNRMQESINLFEETFSQFPEYHWMLIFTKIDIFTYKIQNNGDLNKHYPEYDGNSKNVDAGVNFIKSKYFSVASKFGKDIPSVVINTLNIGDIKSLLETIKTEFMYQELMKVKNLNEEDPKILGDYEIITRLGKGSFGIVFLVKTIKDKIEHIYALKTVPFDQEEELKKIKKEIYILSRLDHENIIKVYEHFYIENSDLKLICFPLTYCDAGDLNTYLKKSSLIEEEILDIAIQITEGISYLHSNKILHRDLKPENILLKKLNDTLQVKIADFGLSKQVYEDFATTFVGTPKYMSPEMYEGQSYSYSSDIWSLGGILFQIFTGTIKAINFRNFKNLDRIQEILNQKFDYKKKYMLLVQRCLHRNPENRPKANVILEELKSFKLEKRTKNPLSETTRRSEPRKFSLQ